MSGAEWLFIIIVGPVIAALAIPLTRWSIRSLAQAIVVEINGELGLDTIRDDMKTLTVQVSDIEHQLENIIVDGKNF